MLKVIAWLIKVGVLCYIFLNAAVYCMARIFWVLFADDYVRNMKAVMPFLAVTVLIVSILIERALPKLDNWTKGSLILQFQELRENGIRVPDSPRVLERRPFWQSLLMFLVMWGYSAWAIGMMVFRFVNWVMNRGKIVLSNYEFTRTGMILMILISFPLVVLFWIFVHKSRRFRSIASIAAMVYAVMTVLTLLGATEFQTGQEAFAAMVQENMMLVNLPDRATMLVGLPAVVLAYYGQDSGLWKTAFRARWIAFTCILLSSTIVSGILKTITASILWR